MNYIHSNLADFPFNSCCTIATFVDKIILSELEELAWTVQSGEANSGQAVRSSAISLDFGGRDRGYIPFDIRGAKTVNLGDETFSPGPTGDT